jgi:hypothetical protein
MTTAMRRFGFVFAMTLMICPLVGCEEDIAEVETPSGEVEIEEEMGGGLEAEVED